MPTNVKFISKTEHYLKVKKPLLERQRRARINKYLNELKNLIAEFQGDNTILRMDKAEMLETTITFMSAQSANKSKSIAPIPMESFRNGYMNAVNEVSRVMAAMPGMSVELGKSVMTHLGFEFNNLLQQSDVTQQIATITPPMSPASSGYHSDNEEITMPSNDNLSIWRPW